MVGTICSAVSGQAARTRAAWLYFLGSVGGSLALASLAALVAAVVPSPSGLTRVALLLTMLVLVVVFEVRLLPMPGPKRQVTSYRWFHSFPGRASFVWGLELGVGLRTIVSSSGLYALVVLPWLVGMPWLALPGLLAFGIARGLQPVIGARFRSPTAVMDALAGAGVQNVLSRTIALFVASWAIVLGWSETGGL